MRNILLTLSSCLLLSTNSFSQITVGSTDITVSVVAEDLDTPWEILWGPDDYIWITERGGTISRMNPTTNVVEVVYTISAVYEESESGLLGMALHPDFNTPGSEFVYVVYTYDSGGGTQIEILERYTYNGTTLTNPTTLLDNIPANDNHSGSRIIVTPDYKILMTTGDAQNTSLSQNTSSLAGKILRLNLDGSIPFDNPNPASYNYTIGHRNPQGLVWASNGILYSSEHGPSNDDEINIITADGNFGWPDVQGYCNSGGEMTFCTANNVIEPITAWTPTLAVAGLDYYDHPAIPEWQNSLLLTNLKERDFRVLELNVVGDAITTETTYFNESYGRLRDVCVSPDGDIYFSTSNRDGRGSPITEDDRIIKLSNEAYVATGVGVNSGMPQLTISPNPAHEIVNVSISGEFTIYDLTATVVNHSTGSQIDVGSLHSGIYILEVIDSNGAKFTTKLVKD